MEYLSSLLAERRVTLKSAAQIEKMAVAGRLVADVLDRVGSEVRAGTTTGELDAIAEDDAHRAEELGDLLFVLVNVGRKTGIEVEAALRAANDKFRRRFRHVELAAAAQGVALRDLSFEELDALWDAAKADERREATA